MYETKLRAFYLEDTSTSETGSKCVLIPLNNLESIGGNAYFMKSKVKDLGKLK